MPLNTNVSTEGMEAVARPVPVVAPPLELQPAKSPFFISGMPNVGAPVNPDSIRNFSTPGIPNYRITPAIPLNLAATNTIPVTTQSVLLPPVPAPTIASPLVNTPTGYAFSFNEVRSKLPSGFEISSYRVYRGPTNNIVLASVIRTFPHSVNGLSTPVQVTDPQPNNVNQCYFVSAVATNGREST